MVRVRDVVLAVVVLGGCLAAVIAHVQTGWPHVGPSWYADNSWWLIPVLILLVIGLFGLAGLFGEGHSVHHSGLNFTFGSSSGSDSGGSWDSSGGSSDSGGATGSW